MRTARTGRCGNCGKVHHALTAALMCEAAHNAMAMVAEALAKDDPRTVEEQLSDEMLMYTVAPMIAPTPERLMQLVREA